MSTPTHTSRSSAPPPNRPTKLLVGLLVLCFLLWCGLSLPRLLEPKYQGKTAEEWYSEVSTIGSGSEYLTKDPAVIGLRHLGTNAVWFLWSERSRKELTLPSPLQKQWDRLSRSPNHPPGFSRGYAAWDVLYEFGPETEVLIPHLLELLKNGDPREAASAAYLLGKTQRHPEVIVPAILQSMMLTNRDIQDRIRHTVGLRVLGPQAKAALPALRAHYTNPAVASTYEGNWVAMAIVMIDGPGPELGRFTNAFVPGDFKKSITPIVLLSWIGTNAHPAVPVMHQFALTLTNASERLQVSNRIYQIDPAGIYQKP